MKHPLAIGYQQIVLDKNSKITAINVGCRQRFKSKELEYWVGIYTADGLCSYLHKDGTTHNTILSVDGLRNDGIYKTKKEAEATLERWAKDYTTEIDDIEDTEQTTTSTDNETSCTP